MGNGGEVEVGEKVPVHNVFDVELDCRHDDPEEVPGKGGDESERQHHPRPGQSSVGRARGWSLVSHRQSRSSCVYIQLTEDGAATKGWVNALWLQFLSVLLAAAVECVT